MAVLSRSARRGPVLLPCFAAVFAVMLIAWISYPVRLEARPEMFLLPGLALLAEFMSFDLAPKRARITLAMPFIAGISLVAGPAAAILLDLFVSTLVGISTIGLRRRLVMRATALRAAVGVLAAASGGLAMVAAPWAAPVRGLAFALVYALVSLTGSYVVSGASRSWVGGSASMLRSGVFYAILASAVCAIIAEQLAPLLVLTLAPVLVLRGVVTLQERANAHYYDTITALVQMLQRSHPYTHGHLERVSRVAEEVAIRLGLSPERARMVREAAVLHDIGKIAVDEVILDAPRALSEEEMDHVRRHAALGAQILAQVPQFVEVSRWILHHHERTDGTGYPYGLKGDDIPIESRIISVADAYDAMIGGSAARERRSYKPSMSKGAALEELRRCAGSQFDPRVVAAFHQVLAGGSV